MSWIPQFSRSFPTTSVNILGLSFLSYIPNEQINRDKLDGLIRSKVLTCNTRFYFAIKTQQQLFISFPEINKMFSGFTTTCPSVTLMLLDLNIDTQSITKLRHFVLQNRGL